MRRWRWTPSDEPLHLSEWGLRHQSLVLFFMAALTLIGLASYRSLGQSEDPPFTFKVMVVRTEWAGATAREVELQITDKIEKKLQELPQIDTLRSYSRPGESLVFFIARIRRPQNRCPTSGTRCARRSATSATPAAGRGRAKLQRRVRRHLRQHLRVGRRRPRPCADETPPPRRCATNCCACPTWPRSISSATSRSGCSSSFPTRGWPPLGLPLTEVVAAISSQNAELGAGFFETAGVAHLPAPRWPDTDPEAIRNTVIRAGGRSLRLGDIAEVRRGFVDPPSDRMRFMGRDALGLGCRCAPAATSSRWATTSTARWRASSRNCRRGRPRAGGRPAARGAALGERVRAGAGRGGDHRAGGEPVVAGPAHRHRGGGDDPGGAGDHLPARRTSSTSACTRSRSVR